MKVIGLWRYPVKSMRGEARDSLDITRHGVEGDRRFGVLDVTSGTIVSAKKDGRLLDARALLAGVELTVRLPTGETALATGPGVDAALSAWLGRPVRLVESRPEGRATYEMPQDFEDDDSEPLRWQGPAGSFVDTAPIHILTTASLRGAAAERPDLQWDSARFRPNILVDVNGDDYGDDSGDDTRDDFVEQGWIGKKLTVGSVAFDIRRPCSRCVMTTRAQPGGIERQLDILRHLNAAHASNLGVWASVAAPGRIEVGQPVSVHESTISR